MGSRHTFRHPPGKHLCTVGLHSSPGDAQLAAILGGVLTPHGLSVLQPPGGKTAHSLCRRLIFGNELMFVCPAHSLGQMSNPPGPPGSSSPFLQVMGPSQKGCDMVGLTADSPLSKQVHFFQHPLCLCRPRALDPHGGSGQGPGSQSVDGAQGPGHHAVEGGGRRHLAVVLALGRKRIRRPT